MTIPTRPPPSSGARILWARWSRKSICPSEVAGRPGGEPAVGAGFVAFLRDRLGVLLPVHAVGRVGHAEVELAALEGVVGERVAEGDVGRVVALGEQVGLADRVGLRVVLLAVQAEPGVGVLGEQVLLGQGEHAAGAGGGVVQRADDAGLGQAGVLLGEEQVDQQPDRVARRVVVTGGLVRGLVELADDVLERVAHVGVRHHVRVQVDRPRTP